MLLSEKFKEKLYYYYEEDLDQNTDGSYTCPASGERGGKMYMMTWLFEEGMGNLFRLVDVAEEPLLTYVLRGEEAAES